MRIQTLVVGRLGTNCYLLVDEKTNRSALIDPGADSDAIEKMLIASGTNLVAIFITHGHFDHYIAVKNLLSLHPEVLVYIDEKDVVDATSQKDLKMPRLPDNNQRFYSDGDILSLGTLSITVMETPGHSRGSVCLIVDNVIFAGDTLFYGSCGRTDLEDGDFTEMLTSLRTLYDLPSDYSVYPGHGPTTTLEFERKNNPFMKKGIV